MATSERQKAAMRTYREANKDFVRELNRKWREANPERIRHNNLRRMGFTTELFNQLMEAQGHRCAVCCTDLRDLPAKQVHADHCHETTTARGILCHHCNSGLGLFKDNPDLLRAAADYLEVRRML